jgi:hypothetical protein
MHTIDVVPPPVISQIPLMVKSGTPNVAPSLIKMRSPAVSVVTPSSVPMAPPEDVSMAKVRLGAEYEAVADDVQFALLSDAAATAALNINSLPLMTSSSWILGKTNAMTILVAIKKFVRIFAAMAKTAHGNFLPLWEI